MTGWTTENMPDQTGRVAVVTGATSGIGYEAALALAGAGAHVVLASRNEAKGAEMLARIRASHPGANVSFESLDLSSLTSVAACADRLSRTLPRIDLLINNAGVMAIPTRHVTVDGFEMQLGANYLGHFALTLRLLPRLLAAPPAPRRDPEQPCPSLRPDQFRRPPIRGPLRAVGGLLPVEAGDIAVQHGA